MDEPIPAYVNIPSITLNTNPSQGSSSSNITDAWVYLDANLQGVYALPAEFPLIAEGTTRLVIYPGIKLNGISATRAAYPFYTADTFDMTLEPKIADTIFPQVRYSSIAVFDFIEDFESGSGFSNIQRQTSEVFEGSASGKLVVTDSSEVTAVTVSGYIIPSTTSAAFLEMDYRNNHVFEAGIRVLIGSQGFNIYKLTIAARNEWNKLYVNFTPEVGQTQADSYQIYFRTLPQPSPHSVEIYFDNLKLIHAKDQ